MNSDGGLSRKPDDKRKRKRKKKKKLAPPPTPVAELMTTDRSPLKRLTKTVLPRRQTLMRYKHSDEDLGESPIKAAKLKLRKPLVDNSATPATTTPTDLAGAQPVVNLNMEEKVTLFRYKSSKILVFDDLPDDVKQSLGRLLGHGAIEIFQLHNGDVTYLSCGPSLIYPLLPKLKVLRIAFNQFIVPLAYPERYWKIFINSEEPNVVQVLENTFESVVKYRNLWKQDPEYVDINKQPAELKELLVDGDIPQFEIALELPPSPPLAPLSPHQFSPEWGIQRKVSDQSISTAMACLEMLKPTIQQPVPTRTNPVLKPVPQRTTANNTGYMTFHQQQNYGFINSRNSGTSRQRDDDAKLDSSMDSLLDEYEESICQLRLMAPLIALRRNLRRNSIALKRGLMYRQRIPIDEHFPTTSLLEYNRIHNTRGLRQSLCSEYHPPRDDWDYNQRLPKSRSNYSMNSTNSDLNSTYRYIYKSIAQRNMRAYPGEDIAARKLPTVPPTPPIPKQYLDTGSVLSAGRRHIEFVPNNSLSQRNHNLDSSEIYTLLSTSGKRGQHPVEAKASKSFTQRLFGW